jgi:N-methylhydantoinase B
VNPVTFSIIRHRLFRAVEEAVMTLKHVSGTAITNEGHDLMVSLYRADGTLLMGGVGFLHHLTSAAEACKAIIRRFKNDIDPGDIFLLNDPYTAALHTSDVYLVSPIHHADELVGWSACFVHVSDIGAMNPGGFAPDANDIFSEGFSSPGIKLVARGQLRRDVWDTLLNMVRSPEMVALDLRSMIACNNVAKERLLALIEKYGFKTVSTACDTLIEQSERRFRTRLRELPNGEWRARQHFDVNGDIFTVVLCLKKRNDHLTFDFTGSSPQSEYGINCSKWAALGGLFAPLFPLLCYDIVWNEGVIKPVTMIAPEGTIVNCVRPAPVSIATVGAIQSVNNAACSAIGKMLAASEKHAHHATAVWHANHFAVFMFGQNHQNRFSIVTLTETFAGAGGARTFADGVDFGGEIPNPISRIANVETIEASFPIRYLYRRRRRDSGGIGRYRGGLGGEFAITAHGSPDGQIRFVLSGKGSRFPQSEGLAGGYPGAANDYALIRRPGPTQDPGGPPPATEQQPISWGVFTLSTDEMFSVQWNGGGGFGDPLERDPSMVSEDVVTGAVSREAALVHFGVVLKDDDHADIDATERRRSSIRHERSRARAIQ